MFFFKYFAATESYTYLHTLSLHDALPICLFWASITRRVGKSQMQGIHLEQGDVIRIEGDHSSVILDGELFEASEGRPIVLRSTQPVPFLRLADRKSTRLNSSH